MSLLFLIGMPASGKTYWGKKVEEHYHLPFIDLDEYVEQNEGMSIAAIFEKQGEDYFRQKESQALNQIIEANKSGVIACGGGTPVFFDNLQVMKNAGCVIYLDVPVTILAERLEKEERSRPLLDGVDDIEARLNDMLASRKMVYEQANFILKDEISITSFKNIIDNV
jgi:shikimate kinase